MALRRILLGSLIVASASVVSASASPFGGRDDARRTVVETVQVVISQFAFAVPEVTARVGDTVEWINKDIVDHTSTEKKDKRWDVTLATGKSSKVTMKAAGTFDYFCRLHPNMTARVVVRPAKAR